MRTSRGFTMVELAVSTAIASVVIMGIFALMTSQIEGHNRQERVTTAQMLVRAAMMESVSRLSKTGFGLPPDYAWGPSGMINNATSAGTMDTCIGTDVIEMRARDVRGTWMLGASSTSSLLNITGVAGLTGDPGWPNGTRVFVFAGIGKLSLVRTNANRAVNATSVGLTAAESASIALPGHATVSTDSQVWAVETTRLRVVCTDPQHPTLMLERDVPVMLKDVDLFHTTQFFLNLIGGGIRVAFVNPYIQIHEDMDFAITIGTNRGANYRLFDGVIEAEAWLLGRINPGANSSPIISSEAKG